MFSTIGSTRASLLKLAFPLVLLVAAASLQAQDKPTQAPAITTMKLTETLTPQQTLNFREMAALRALMGGEVSQRLQGVVPGSDPDKQFHDSLRTFAAQVETPPLTLRPRSNRKPAAGPAQNVLRVSAKKLEDLAAELEQAKFYDKADELRATAAKYWLQARSLD